MSTKLGYYTFFEVKEVRVRGNPLPTLVRFGLTWHKPDGTPIETIKYGMVRPDGTVLPPSTYSRGSMRPTGAIKWSEEFTQELEALFRDVPKLAAVVERIQPDPEPEGPNTGPAVSWSPKEEGE